MMTESKSTKEVENLLEQALQALHKGNHDEAVQLLYTAADIAPLRTDIRDLLSIALDHQIEAQKGKTRSFHREAENFKSEGIRVSRKRNRFPSWIKWISFLFAVSMVLLTVGFVILFQEQIKGFLKTWVEKNIPLNPEDENKKQFLDRAEGYLREGLYDECIRVVEKERQKFPDISEKINEILSEAHFKTGEAFYQKDRYKEAIDHYKKAVTINQNRADYHHALGWAYYVYGLKSKNTRKTFKTMLTNAEETMKRAIELDKESSQYVIDLAKIYVAMDRRDKAVEEYKKVIEIAPEDSDDYNLARKQLDNLLGK